MSITAAYHASAPAQVDFRATVSGAPHFFAGRRAEHESFDVASAAGPVEVVDNVSIAKPVAVAPGDRVEISGQMVHDPGRIPIVHWTHHDPRGVHAGGFIRWRGATYA